MIQDGARFVVKVQVSVVGNSDRNPKSALDVFWAKSPWERDYCWDCFWCQNWSCQNFLFLSIHGGGDVASPLGSGTVQMSRITGHIRTKHRSTFSSITCWTDFTLPPWILYICVISLKSLLKIVPNFCSFHSHTYTLQIYRSDKGWQRAKRLGDSNRMHFCERCMCMCTNPQVCIISP